jgi:hypothetical protein
LDYEILLGYLISIIGEQTSSATCDGEGCDY